MQGKSIHPFNPARRKDLYGSTEGNVRSEENLLAKPLHGMLGVGERGGDRPHPQPLIPKKDSSFTRSTEEIKRNLAGRGKEQFIQKLKPIGRRLPPSGRKPPSHMSQHQDFIRNLCAGEGMGGGTMLLQHSPQQRKPFSAKKRKRPNKKRAGFSLLGPKSFKETRSDQRRRGAPGRKQWRGKGWLKKKKVLLHLEPRNQVVMPFQSKSVGTSNGQKGKKRGGHWEEKRKNKAYVITKWFTTTDTKTQEEGEGVGYI